MRLWQANIGRGVSDAEFRLNLRRVLHAGGPRAVFAFQEIDEADAPEEMDYLRELTAKSHTIVGKGTAVPILVPNHLGLLDSWQTPACKGLAKYTPNRVVNQALIEINPHLAVMVLNTHLPINRPATLTRRAQVRRSLRKQSRNWDKGLWVADTNTHVGWPRIAKGEKSVINAGIDKSKAWAPKGWRVTVSDRRTVDLSIDGHNAHGARIRWEGSA